MNQEDNHIDDGTQKDCESCHGTLEYDITTGEWFHAEPLAKLEEEYLN